MYRNSAFQQLILVVGAVTSAHCILASAFLPWLSTVAPTAAAAGDTEIPVDAEASRRTAQQHGRPVPPLEMKIMDLPDEALMALFDALGRVDPQRSPSGRMAVADCADAAAREYKAEEDPRRAFSQLCRRLDVLFRRQYVKSLQVTPRRECMWDCILRALLRYPGSRIVRVRDAYRGQSVAPVSWQESISTQRMFRELQAARKVVQQLDVVGSWAMPQQDAARLFRDVVPALRSLRVESRSNTAGTIVLFIPVASFPVGVQNMSPDGNGDGSILSDGRVLQLSGLLSKRNLALTDTYGFVPRALEALGELPTIEFDYKIAEGCTAVDMNALEDGISRMTHLQVLRITIQGETRPESIRLRTSLLDRLPPMLKFLIFHVEFAEWLPTSAFHRLTALAGISLKMNLGSWAALASLPPSLRFLEVTDHLLTDDDAEEAFSSPAFRGLEVLNLACCLSIPDAIAELVAGLPLLTHLNLNLVRWSDRTIAKAVAGLAPVRTRRLKSVDLMGCLKAHLGVARVLTDLPELEELRMGGTRIEQEGFLWLNVHGAFPRLNILSISIYRCCEDGLCQFGRDLMIGLKQRPGLDLTVIHIDEEVSWAHRIELIPFASAICEGY